MDRMAILAKTQKRHEGKSERGGGVATTKLVCVIGLHAVQFVNDWMKKIPRTAKLDEAAG